ncbi:UNVERIFIED_ORG: hypothetical protein CLV66_101216 [Actinomadura viridilutea]|nr:hypothetical protein [Actinomadura rubrobrunea]
MRCRTFSLTGGSLTPSMTAPRFSVQQDCGAAVRLSAHYSFDRDNILTP